MDERMWSKARSLAYVFGNTYDEDVAVVLGEALLETLAELLVPEEEKEMTCAQKFGNYVCTEPEHHTGPHVDGHYLGRVTWTGCQPPPSPFVKVDVDTLAKAKVQHPAFTAAAEVGLSSNGANRFARGGKIVPLSPSE